MERRWKGLPVLLFLPLRKLKGERLIEYHSTFKQNLEKIRKNWV
jgi:hypothetical protein